METNQAEVFTLHDVRTAFYGFRKKMNDLEHSARAMGCPNVSVTFNWRHPWSEKWETTKTSLIFWDVNAFKPRRYTEISSVQYTISNPDELAECLAGLVEDFYQYVEKAAPITGFFLRHDKDITA